MAHVVYIHGLDNKPEAAYLHELWNRKLAQDDGLDLASLGVVSSMVYWADIMYPTPDTDLAAYESVAGIEESLGPVPALDLSSLDQDDRRRFDALAQRLGIDPTQADSPPAPATDIEQVRLERVPLPAWARKRLMKRLARDAYYYFFNLEFSCRPDVSYRVRDEKRRRFIDALRQASGSRPLTVVSHSMGTIIAYDCLKHVPDCPAIDALVTIGSPLGLDEVQDFFPQYKAANAFPGEKLRGPWLNVYDPLDAIAMLDPVLANDFRQDGQRVVQDLAVTNSGSWRHSISKYMRQPQLRRRIAGFLGPAGHDYAGQ